MSKPDCLCAAALLLVSAATLGWGGGGGCSHAKTERIKMRLRADALERTVSRIDSDDTFADGPSPPPRSRRRASASSRCAA
jgi:hypothetical protein